MTQTNGNKEKEKKKKNQHQPSKHAELRKAIRNQNQFFF